MLSSSAGGGAETITSFALQNGYRLLDTAALYGYAPIAFSSTCVKSGSYYLLYFVEMLVSKVEMLR